jgi:hypothetical protein
VISTTNIRIAFPLSSVVLNNGENSTCVLKERRFEKPSSQIYNYQHLIA